MFARQARSVDGRYCYCKPCSTAYAAEWRAKNAERLRAKSRAGYAANPERRREDSKRYRERHRERLAPSWSARRRAVTLAQYGLTPAEYDARLAQQGGGCAICETKNPNHFSGRFQVDHDHQTGAVRGLLCSGCNGGLGLFKDDAERLKAAIDYLQRAGSDITVQIAAAGFFRAS